jgi:N6-L-threonylcarbamoyladenine synthase
VLNVHHIESRKTGGDSPDNLITLCETCHKAYHKGKVNLNFRRGVSYRDAAFMGIMRWAFYNRLKEVMPEKEVRMTYGYLTKNTRIKHGLPKTHAVDARCISGNPLAEPLESCFYQKKVRCHNRQLHKMTIGKGGYRKANQAEKYVFGYQLFDKVKMPTGEEGFVMGRRASGSFDIRKLDGSKLSAGISYKKLKPLEKRKSNLTERRERCSSPMPKGRGIRNVNFG